MSEESKNIDIQEIDSLIRFARAYCAEKLPWFSPALFQCQIELTNQVPLAAIDQHLNIYFNPEAVQKIADAGDMESTLSQLGFVWIHEISHILREHGDRAKAFNAKHGLWNVAADLEINDSKWEGLAPPEIFPLVFPETYNLPPGQLTEYYYEQLQEQKKKKEEQKQSEEQGKEDGPNNPGDETEDNNQDNPDNDQDQDDNKKGDQEGDNDQEADHPDEGSGVHGKPRSWELEPDTPPEEREMQLQDAKQHKDGLEVEMIRKAVAQALNDSKDQSDIPGGWDRWAKEHLKPSVNWKQVLKHRMNIAISKGVGSRVDYNYSRPSRRQASHPKFILPSLRGDVSAKIAVVVDTSGSIKDRELSQIMGEIMGVLKIYKSPVTVIPCDSKAYKPIELATSSDLFKIEKMPGGGGTNMIVGIEAAMDLKPRPDSILVLTDGFTPYPKKRYPVPVLFGILKLRNKISRRPPNPPWGKDTVVEIELGKKNHKS